ncbi:hypothetical protein PCC9214_04695 [Planktothrix tepida]|uniref:Inactive STAND domain-containing protein n=1 Tax=Planktothrix tepida PCC 9214 TaxID=671072 RepID=A0A1J1LNV3_9CYAN|nr:hypothetical protein [Planktothrix tepida]CAD5980723.1 hypothetical protein PCC9214_04695 [Planktothrix tepida]CUR33682.1 hypothetical protein PL9214520221 [Planktothrix tepida PCC 9214]
MRVLHPDIFFDWLQEKYKNKKYDLTLTLLHREILKAKYLSCDGKILKDTEVNNRLKKVCNRTTLNIYKRICKSVGEINKDKQEQDLPKFCETQRDERETLFSEWLQTQYASPEFQQYLTEHIGSNQEDEQAEQVYQSLLRLDFRKSSGIFADWEQQNKPAACLLVYGKKKHGQEWIMRRLMTKPKYSKRMFYTCSFSSYISDSKKLWKWLSEKIGIQFNRKQLLEENQLRIIKALKEQLQYNNIVLIFTDLQANSLEYPQEFIDQFWVPLCNRLFSQQAQPNSCNKLLVFLLADEPEIKNWCQNWVSNINENWSITEPIQLPEPKPICPEDDLIPWLKQETDYLPRQLTVNPRKTAQEILSKTNQGVPEAVLMYIYSDLCQYDQSILESYSILK